MSGKGSRANAAAMALGADLDGLRARVQTMEDASRARAALNRAHSPEFAEFVATVRRRAPGARVTWVRWPDGTEEGKRQ